MSRHLWLREARQPEQRQEQFALFQLVSIGEPVAQTCHGLRNGRTDNSNRDREAQAASPFQEDFSAIRIRLRTVFKVSASRSLR